VNNSPAIEKRKRGAAEWLITYADLMTLLVVFFVLIISFSVQDEAKMQVVAGSIREAFGVTSERRFAGERTLEGTPEQRQPGAVLPVSAPSGDGLTQTLSARPAAGAAHKRGAHESADAARRAYEAAKERLEHAILLSPITKGAEDGVTINLTKTGLQVILVDTAGRAMFDRGSAEPTAQAKQLLKETARALLPLANRITINADADATGGSAYSPFDLTTARANAARRIIEEAGFPEKRIAAVTGRGASFPLYPEDPYAPGNRRIEITLEPAAPLLPEDSPL